MVTGGITAAIGFAVIPFITSKARQQHELKRIDKEITALAIAPVVSIGGARVMASLKF